jgi:hypothetical protein
MTLTVRSATVSGATTKGSALTHAELDENFNHLSQSSNHTFTPSGSGAVARTVSSALTSNARSGDFDTAANFKTAVDALTETWGFHSIQCPDAGLDFKFKTSATEMTFDEYAFGTKIALAGGDNDNRLELYLGSTDTEAAELSVRHNGNNTGAKIQARNAGDDDGMFISFEDSTYPFVRWGNAGPYLIKDSAGVLVMRNKATVGEAQRLWIANTFTPGDVREYLQLGFISSNAVVRTTGVGGGSQRTLILDGSTLQVQTGSTARWNVNGSGHFLAATDNSFDIGASGATRPKDAYLAGKLVASGASGSAIGAATSSTTALNLPAGTTGVSTLRIAHGAAPTSPVDGDMWTTTAGLFVRINGSTVGPLSWT